MVHETKLLTFWRAINAEMEARDAAPVDLETARIFQECGYSAEKVADILDIPVKRYHADFQRVFGGN